MTDGKERRRYFRVNDRVSLRYGKFGSEAESSGFSLREKLATSISEIDAALIPALDAMRSRMAPHTDVLDLLNRKLNVLVTMIGTPADSPQSDLPMFEVSLSACGIAFAAHDPALRLNDALWLDLVLVPSYHSMRLKGTVVGKDPHPSGMDWIRVRFDDIGDAEQEVLVKHAIQCQTRELKKLRETQKA